MKTIPDKLNELLLNVGDMALKRRARRIIEELELKKGDKILDMGCGNGYYSFLLAKLPIGLKITGIDNDINAIEDAKRIVGERKAKFITGDAENLPFPKESFDKVLMSEIIEHVKDDIKVLQEVKRVLKPGGIVVLTTPNRDYPFLWDPINWILDHLLGFHIKSGFWAGIWNQHLRLYKVGGIKEKMAKSGFTLDCVELLTFWCLPFNHYLVNLGARLLYGRRLSKDLSDDINKFSESKNKKTRLANFLFWLVNTYDKLNDIFPNGNGVSIFIKAK